MTAATADPYADTISPAWRVYRHTQGIPWPMTGGKELLMAQSRLWHLAEPYASGREQYGADLPAIAKATSDLIAAVRRYCGDEWAGELDRLVPEPAESEAAA